MRFITNTRTFSGRLRCTLARVGALFVLVVGSAPVVAQESDRSPAADWPTYNRDLAGTRYSPLDQIDMGNVGELQEV